MTTITYMDEDRVEQVSVYPVMASTMAHQLTASGCQVLATTEDPRS